MRIVVRTRLPKSQVRLAIQRLPAILAGRAADPQALARGVQLRCGMMALSLIKDAFVVKSLGGTDEAGEKWAPLAQSTIESRLRRGGGQSRARAVKSLKAAYSTVARTGRGQKKLAAAKKKAAATFQAASSLEILRDTGVLMNSLSPGVQGPMDANTEFRHEAGLVAVGTNVPYAIYHHSDEPRQMKADGSGPRLPQRRLWPKQWPASWVRQIGEAAATGVARALELCLNRGQLF